MTSVHFASFALLLTAGLVAQARPASFELTLVDGSQARGDLVDWTEDKIQLATAAGQRALPAKQVLFLHGPATTVAHGGQMMLHLARGQVLAGEIVGGDEDGEGLTIRTLALGTTRVVLDRLLLLRVQQQGRFYDPRLYAPPVGQEGKETVFRWTPLGLDPVSGFLERVSGEGVVFEWRQQGKADLFPWKDIAGLRLPRLEAPESVDARDLELVLLTADGCRVQGVPRGVQNQQLVVKSLELGELRVSLDRILAGHVVAGNRVLLANLTPTKIEERHFFKPTTDHAFQRDRNVEGEILKVRQSYWTTGLGCHSLSRLTYLAPAGMTKLVAWVGPDASAVSEEAVGDMDFRIYVNGKSVAEQTGVRGGQDVRAVPPLPVKQGDEVMLELGFGGNAHIRDRGNWLAPAFVR